MSYSIGISPCPNDTFALYALFNESITDLVLDVSIQDLQQLNQRAQKKELDIVKVSMFQFSKLLDDYILLPVGCALGHNVGPKIIGKTFATSFEDKCIAFAGKDTTAHFLFDLFFTCKEKVFCPYFEITQKIQDGTVDYGVIIHETRFTFESLGLVECYDLGALWEKRFCLPLPLGGIVAKRNLVDLEKITKSLFSSLQYAKKYCKKTMEFVLKHSIEKDPEVVKKHIETYVTQETQMLTPIGIQAIQCFLELTGHLDKNWLYSGAYV